MTSVPASTDAVRECYEVLVRWLQSVDHKTAAASIELFTTDADITARQQHHRGHDETLDFLQIQDADTEHRTAHQVSNPLVVHHDEGHVTLAARITAHVWSPDTGYRVEAILDTTQRFRREDNCWRIEWRRATPLHT